MPKFKHFKDFFISVSENLVFQHKSQLKSLKNNTLKIQIKKLRYVSLLTENKESFLTRGDRVSSLNDTLCRYFFDHLELIFCDETLPAASQLPTLELRQKK